MTREQWLRRLARQLSGWGVWYASSPHAGWYAVPAPPGASLDEKLALPHRLGPYRTPQALRADAQARYGWHDTCDTCNVPARTCGHRQPEQDKQHP